LLQWRRGMKISLIAAVARNGVIGRDNDLPWHLPEDLRHFQTVTWGHTLVMGRRTWESFATPLPGRRILVVTRQHGWQPEGAPEGVEAVASLDAAVERARRAGETELFIAGGTEIYRAALPFADRMYLTRIDAEVPGDTWFPPFDAAAWTTVEETRHEPDADHLFAVTFQTFDRL
jgi:dihydrofolate reductase